MEELSAYQLHELMEKVQTEAQQSMLVLSLATAVLEETNDKMNVLDMVMDLESLEHLTSTLQGQLERLQHTMGELPEAPPRRTVYRAATPRLRYRSGDKHLRYRTYLPSSSS